MSSQDVSLEAWQDFSKATLIFLFSLEGGLENSFPSLSWWDIPGAWNKNHVTSGSWDVVNGDGVIGDKEPKVILILLNKNGPQRWKSGEYC